jgi:DNA invertase Pin-like site-specific DNA recombinase
MAKRAFIYTRTNTEQQGRGESSLEVQKAACVDYCTANGYHIAGTFAEITSGTAADRRELRNIDAVVVHSIDRIARDAAGYLDLRRVLQSLGITVQSVTESTDQTVLPLVG